MKKRLLATLCLLLPSLGLADPFVWPDAWTADPGEAVFGGTFRAGSVGNPRTLNPLVSAEENSVLDLTSEGASLFKQGPDSPEWLPYAAQSFTVSEDGTVIDVVLREGVKWSDGRPVTVQDYLFAYQAWIDPEVGANGREEWFIDGELIELTVTGERSLRFTFPRPDRTAFGLVGSHQPLPDHILGERYRQGGAEALRSAWGVDVNVHETVWTSAWVPVSFEPDERLVFERNPYFGEWNVDEAGNPLPYLERINVSLLVSNEAALNLFLAGELDAFNSASLDEFGVINAAVQNGDLDATLIESASPVAGSQFIIFNWNKAGDPFREALFRSPDFRHAMSHLVDREAIIELVFGGSASPMWTGVYQVLDFWVNPDVAKFPFDPEAALELLGGLGFQQRGDDGVLRDAQGWALEFTLAVIAGDQSFEQIGQIFADSAREVGVNVDVQAVDFNVLVDRLLVRGDDRPFDAILIGLVGADRDWPFSANELDCNGLLHGYNLSGGCLFELEKQRQALQNLGRQTLSTEEARAIGFEIQALEAELMPFVYTVSPSWHVGWSNTLGGAHPRELINSIVGSRELVLTFKRQ
ncbi:MAG: ABC transporter substrate-binding protein [Trueperaceae bacterium]|nr:MAG: ABC transporter substrate-binding protein [Trueperaceae bacterium]